MKLVDVQGKPDRFDIPGGLIATIQWNWFERIFMRAKQTQYFSRFGIIWYYKRRNGRTVRTEFGDFVYGVDRILDHITDEYNEKEGSDIVNTTMKNLQDKGLTLIK